MRLLLAFLLASCSAAPSGPSDPGDLGKTPVAGPDMAELTWSDFARQFFLTYCTSCHSPSGEASQLDFTQYAMVQANAATIVCGLTPANMPQPDCSGSGVQPGQFPIGTGPKPTDAQRLEVLAWIADGLPR